LAERQPSKLHVASSNLVSRSIPPDLVLDDRRSMAVRPGTASAIDRKPVSRSAATMPGLTGAPGSGLWRRPTGHRAPPMSSLALEEPVRRSLTIFAVGALAAAILAPATVAKAPPSTGPTGVGTVFLPNPVAALGIQSLTDQKDADYAALQPAYHDVTLTNLDGSGLLHGDWANVVAATGPLASSPSNTFPFHRDDDRFEQVMAYYWVTEAQKYIQSLGFGSSRRAVNKESQDIRTDQWGADNSFSWDKHDLLRFGKGGVDDAEDADVVLHEYGHAIQDAQVATFGTSPEAGAIGEGFGDYWAATVTSVLAPTADPACIADWDAVSYTSTVPHCLRRVDGDKQYPADLEGKVHADGEIWSRALWDIRGALGHVRADTVILEAQFAFTADTSMPAAARATVAAAQLLYGTSTANTVRHAFEARGIL
jgi:zinc metalloprotease ZmpB